jgi:regulator of replication initiation timing
MDITQQLADISNKIHQARQQMDELKSENLRLLAENEWLREQLALCQKAAAEPPQPATENAPQATGENAIVSLSSLAVQDIRPQIDHYLREIDKCIQRLEQR